MKVFPKLAKRNGSFINFYHIRQADKWHLITSYKCFKDIFFYWIIAAEEWQESEERDKGRGDMQQRATDGIWTLNVQFKKGRRASHWKRNQREFGKCTFNPLSKSLPIYFQSFDSRVNQLTVSALKAEGRWFFNRFDNFVGKQVSAARWALTQTIALSCS